MSLDVPPAVLGTFTTLVVTSRRLSWRAGEETTGLRRGNICKCTAVVAYIPTAAALSRGSHETHSTSAVV